MTATKSRRHFLAAALAGSVYASTGWGATAPAGIPIPGTGTRLAGLGDDFEDESWSYNYAGPKSSWNIDKQQRLPGGMSSNRRWAEAAMRGQPDIVKRVTPPPGGIEGSTGAMLLQSLHSGVPSNPTGEVQQDDFLHNTGTVIKNSQMPIAWTPNVITRVYCPAFTQWEKRTGNSFGFRSGMRATHKKEKDGVTDYEEYWPGFFIWFNYGRWKQGGADSAKLVIRSDQNGRDISGPALKEATWYTLGMSFTPDGYVHYFVGEGTSGLNQDNYIRSFRPYGFQPRTFETFFFNTVCKDDGHTWSTPWVIDDSWLSVSNPPASGLPRTARR